MLLLAIANGAVREAWLAPWFGALAAHWLSTLLLCALFAALIYWRLSWLDLASERAALCLGASWMAATVAFEFLGGHYLFGNPWEKLLSDYNVFKGRVWPVVLLTLLLAPWASWRLRSSRD